MYTHAACIKYMYMCASVRVCVCMRGDEQDRGKERPGSTIIISGAYPAAQTHANDNDVANDILDRKKTCTCVRNEISIFSTKYSRTRVARV